MGSETYTTDETTEFSSFTGTFTQDNQTSWVNTVDYQLT